jgi:hypothetical protein
MTWIDAADGYQVRLAENGKVVSRNSKGKQLASVPAALKDTEQVLQLRQLAEWLKRHEAECHATVDRWMVRAEPVPVAVISEVWPDPAWQNALRDLVVVADGTTGFLRDADPGRGVGVVDLDGDTVWARSELVTIPHPVLLEDLDDLREFGAELGVEQKVQQLFRQTFTRTDAAGENVTENVTEFANGRFEQLQHAFSRCRTLGYQLKGGYAVYTAVEGGRPVEARYWLGDGYPEGESYTEDLSWTRDGVRLPITEVGPIAWSEGMRMASLIYAGRVVA